MWQGEVNCRGLAVHVAIWSCWAGPPDTWFIPPNDDDAAGIPAYLLLWDSWEVQQVSTGAHCLILIAAPRAWETNLKPGTLVLELLFWVKWSIRNKVTLEWYRDNAKPRGTAKVLTSSKISWGWEIVCAGLRSSHWTSPRITSGAEVMMRQGSCNEKRKAGNKLITRLRMWRSWVALRWVQWRSTWGVLVPKGFN